MARKTTFAPTHVLISQGRRVPVRLISESIIDEGGTVLGRYAEGRFWERGGGLETHKEFLRPDARLLRLKPGETGEAPEGNDRTKAALAARGRVKLTLVVPDWVGKGLDRMRVKGGAGIGDGWAPGASAAAVFTELVRYHLGPSDLDEITSKKDRDRP